MGSSVWVFTQRLDSTADVVIEELNRRGVPVARFDLDEITVTAELDGDHWVGSLSTPSRTVELDDVAGIYYRRPSPASAPPNVDPEAVEWVEAEIRWGLRGLLVALPRTLWFNWPPAVHAAEHKPYQLVTAAECGLSVPRTAIVNDPAGAARFAAQAGPVLYKAFRSGPVRIGGRTHLTYATPVTASQCDTETVRIAPIMLQTIVEKVGDARVTVVDSQLFGITPRGPVGTVPLDWRIDYNALDWQPIEIPAPVATELRKFCDRMDLRFIACDFSIDRDGTWWWLEANPVGQWAWEHPLVDQLASAIADALTGQDFTRD